MPFDPVRGEALDGLDGKPYIVIESRLLAQMDNLKTPYTIKDKFRTIRKVRSVFDDAVAHAIEGFASEGALRPIRFDEDAVLVQVYPKDLKVAVIFQRAIAGKDHYVTRIYDLPAPVLDALLGPKKELAH